jgi:antitoxin ParD1/3/4
MPSSFALGDHFEKLIDRLVESGRYNSRSEVVREGLRILENKEEERRIAMEKFGDFVEEGIASGGYKPIEDIFDEIDHRLSLASATAAE